MYYIYWIEIWMKILHIQRLGWNVGVNVKFWQNSVINDIYSLQKKKKKKKRGDGGSTRVMDGGSSQNLKFRGRSTKIHQT
jgi:hypothetical protein